MNENFSFIQSLAKKYHKVSNKNNKKITELSPLLEYSSMNTTHPHNYSNNNSGTNSSKENNISSSGNNNNSNSNYYSSSVSNYNSLSNFYYNEGGYNHLNYNNYNKNNFYGSGNSGNYYNNYMNNNSNSSFREEILNWLFELSSQDRMKVLTIENKYLASMVHQMYLKYKTDNKFKFQIKNDTYNDEEMYFSQFMGNMNNNFVYSAGNSSGSGCNGNSNINNELSLDNYFNIKADHCKSNINCI